MSRAIVRLAVLGLFLLYLGGCSNGVPASLDELEVDTTETDGNNPDDTSNTPGDTSLSWDTSDYDTSWGGPGPCIITLCQNHKYHCGDCIDNDSDGEKDSRDPDCLGPCDNNETGFRLEIPGGTVSSCGFDCYFDQDNGTPQTPGEEDCQWNHLCDTDHDPGVNHTDTDDPTCDYDKGKPPTVEECNTMWTTQGTTCTDVCRPLVPNGCDCWGCCSILGENRWIGTPGCSLDNLEACDLCTPLTICENSCENCEICLGKPELPPDCTQGQECPDGSQQCGQPGDDPCPPGDYCVTGCCVFAGPM